LLKLYFYFKSKYYEISKNFTLEVEQILIDSDDNEPSLFSKITHFSDLFKTVKLYVYKYEEDNDYSPESVKILSSPNIKAKLEKLLP